MSGDAYYADADFDESLYMPIIEKIFNEWE